MRLTQSGDTLGTPLYMSPEQVEGRPIDHRTDVYSFGVTCYHMMAGEPPFTGATPYEVAFKHVQEEPKPLATIRPDLPEGLCVVIHKMMAKDPADRFQTASELLDEISRLAQGEAALASRPRPRKARRLPWLFAASVLLAVLGGAGYAWQRRHAAAQPATNGGTAPINPADAEVEGILPSHKREQALRAAVEEYLNPQDKTARDEDTGFRLCRDLGVCYLENGRLDEAEKLFDRLEKYAAPYRPLGELGLAVVLALNDKPAESNERFDKLSKGPMFSRVVAFWSEERKGPGRRPDALPPALQMWSAPALRFWVVQALRYNQKNDWPDAKVPGVLLKLRDKKVMPQ